MALTSSRQIKIIAQLTFKFLMCFSITGFSNLFTNESNDVMFVYLPSNSKYFYFVNWGPSRAAVPMAQPCIKIFILLLS